MRIHIGSFFDELEKIAWGNAAEIAGLGVLAAPSVSTLMDSKESKKEKNHARFETAGLGVLAAHPAYEMAKGLLTKKASDLWNPSTGAVVGSEGGSRAANRGVSLATSKPSVSPKPKFTLDTLKSAYKAQGMKPRLSSIAR